jgi:hypothetical protein
MGLSAMSIGVQPICGIALGEIRRRSDTLTNKISETVKGLNATCHLPNSLRGPECWLNDRCIQHPSRRQRKFRPI